MALLRENRRWVPIEPRAGAILAESDPIITIIARDEAKVARPLGDITPRRAELPAMLSKTGRRSAGVALRVAEVVAEFW